MSLDIDLIDPTSTYKTHALFETNITHNLGKMASKAGIYEALWRPHRLVDGYDIPEDDHHAERDLEDSVTVKAKDIIPIIEKGLDDLKGWVYRH